MNMFDKHAVKNGFVDTFNIIDEDARSDCDQCGIMFFTTFKMKWKNFSQGYKQGQRKRLDIRN